MGLLTLTRKLSPAGGAGVATATDTFGVPSPCRLQAVHIDYTSQPATTDVTLTHRGKTIYTRVNANTDSYEFPRLAGVDGVGAALPAGDNRWVEPVLNGVCQLDVAQGDQITEGVKVTLIVEV